MISSANSIFEVAKAIDFDTRRELGPPEEGLYSETQRVPRSVVRRTRRYIEKVANQANGCHKKGWYEG
jgi:hypothetical protein